MKLWKIIVPAGLAAGAAAAAVIAMKKAPAAAPKAAPAKGEAKTAPAPIAHAETGVYSFVSGFQNPCPVEVGFTYDRDKFSFDIIGEDFPIPTSDSHAILMEGEDFSLQMEYASLYGGQSFADLAAEAKEKYTACEPVKYGAVEGIKYIAGDNICLCLPVDAESYLLVYMIKAKGNDDPITALPDYPDAAAIFGSMQVKR